MADLYRHHAFNPDHDLFGFPLPVSPFFIALYDPVVLTVSFRVLGWSALGGGSVIVVAWILNYPLAVYIKNVRFSLISSLLEGKLTDIFLL